MRPLVLALVLLFGCHASRPRTYELVGSRAFASDPIGCPMASPLLVRSQGESFVLVTTTDGFVHAFEPASGALAWSIALDPGQATIADATSTPVAIDASHVAVAFQRELAPSYARVSHHAVVIDLEARALDPSFPLVTFTASIPGNGGPVPFLPGNAFSRSALVHGTTPAAPSGFVYVGFGNQRDIQPWHGWLFELDVAAWASGGTAVSSVLLATPESDCGPSGVSGSRDTICGGGIWSPAGPRLAQRDDGFDLYVPTGNGQLDLARDDYANTVIRTGPGLAITPGCDPVACAGFDPLDPARACLDSCAGLFVPRLLAGDPPLAPESGVCDGLTFFECYAALDWDLGADTPARVSLPGGPDLLVLPAKDGSVYLFDAEHLGTLYDREPIVAACGTASDPCVADWAGMMVTEPAVTEIDGTVFVVIPTFMFDRTHPAGIVALRVVVEAGVPQLVPAWKVPDFATPDAIARFRSHPGRPAIVTIEGEVYVAVVEVASAGRAGTLWVVRVRDGALAARVALAYEGNRYVAPLVHEGRIFVTSCPANPPSTGRLEAIDLALRPSADAGMP